MMVNCPQRAHDPQSAIRKQSELRIDIRRTVGTRRGVIGMRDGGGLAVQATNSP